MFGNHRWNVALQILFGDDEHTAADGPYPRVMKTRKWLYLASVAAFLITGGWYDPAAMTKVLASIVRADVRLLVGALGIGLLYLLVQYAMLVAQLVISYEIVLKDRFVFRRQDELVLARQNAADARNEVARVYERLADASKRERDKAQAELDEAESQLKAIGEVVDEAEEGLLTQIKSASALIARNAHAEAVNKVEHLKTKNFDLSRHPDFLAARAAADQLDQQLQTLAKQDPSSNRSYRRLERSIDALRVFPPMVFAFIALWHIAVAL